MPQVNVIALHDGAAVTAALQQAAACVDAAKLPQHLRRDAFTLAFTALTARSVQVTDAPQMPLLPDGILRG